jgi:hypothetical protein
MASATAVHRSRPLATTTCDHSLAFMAIQSELETTRTTCQVFCNQVENSNAIAGSGRRRPSLELYDWILLLRSGMHKSVLFITLPERPEVALSKMINSKASKILLKPAPLMALFRYSASAKSGRPTLGFRSREFIYRTFLFGPSPPPQSPVSRSNVL